MILKVFYNINDSMILPVYQAQMITKVVFASYDTCWVNTHCVNDTKWITLETEVQEIEA